MFVVPLPCHQLPGAILSPVPVVRLSLRHRPEGWRNAATEPEGFTLITGLSIATENIVSIGGNVWESNPATNVRFYTHNATTDTAGGSERMRITGDGNVGIGTTSPAEKLEVAGSVYVNSENNGFIVDAGGNARVGLMKYGGAEGVISRVAGQDFGIVRTGSSDIHDILVSKLNPKENDVIVIGSGENKTSAEIGAKMALLELLRLESENK